MPSYRRILFVDHAGVLGGAELYLLDVALQYRDRATVLLFEDGPFRQRLERDGIAVDVLPAPSGFLSVQKESGALDALRAIPGLLSLMHQVARRAREYDLIFANSQKALIVAGLAALWAERPLVWNLHDILTADHFSSINRRLAVRVANACADRIIVNSRATQEAFAESGGDVTRCHVVYNGLDPSRFSPPDPNELKSLQEEIGLEDGTPVMGIFSRLAPWKGQHVLIDALTDLPSVHALLVGAALFGGDETYVQSLRQRAAHEGVADRVHFLGFRDDVPALMHLVDVVVHTSVAPEPFGRVIVEGMLTHTPVVATRAGGAREIINTGDTGLLVEPGDPSALSEALRTLLNNPLQAKTMAEAAHQKAQSTFSRAAMLERIDEVLAPVFSS
jgi:glycosyltransferase involved in cell wall biosynthesis